MSGQSQTDKGWGKSSAVISAISVLGLATAFLRETVLAYFFGASAEMDVFLVAALPIEIMVLVGPTLAWSLIPMLTEVRANQGHSGALCAFKTILSIVVVATGMMAVLLSIVSRRMVVLLAPGFVGAQIDLASSMMRLIAGGILLIAVSGLLTGALNTYRHFWAPVAAGIVLNLSVIGVVSVLGGSLGVETVAVGMLLGLLLQLAILILLFYQKGLRLGVTLSWDYAGLRTFSNMLWPLLAQALLGRIYVFVDRYVASMLAGGSISLLNYATKVSTLPVVLIVTAIGTVLYPYLTEWHSKQQREEFENSLMKGLRVGFLLIIPMVALLAALANPVIALLFERGAFTQQDTKATANLLLWYSGGIVVWVGADLGTRALWALKESRLTLWISVLFFATNAAAALVLARLFGLEGVAGARTLALVVYMAVTLYALNARLAGRPLAQLLGFVFRVLVSAGIAGTVVLFLSSKWIISLSLGSLVLLVRSVAIGSVGVAVYLFFILAVFRLQEGRDQ